MKNRIGGTVVQVSWDHLIEMVDKPLRTRMCDLAAREDVDGVVGFRIEQMDSSHHGHVTFAIYGPGCTWKTLEDARRLGDVPSCFAYPFCYWSKS